MAGALTAWLWALADMVSREDDLSLCFGCSSRLISTSEIYTSLSFRFGFDIGLFSLSDEFVITLVVLIERPAVFFP